MFKVMFSEEVSFLEKTTEQIWTFEDVVEARATTMMRRQAETRKKVMKTNVSFLNMVV
jgi:hypothetical protein